MRQRLRFLWVLFGLSVASLVRAAVPVGDSLRVSLLTCGPGEEAYSVYGHTAIRVQDQRTGEDWVFNYGVFDFDQPHFIWRFVLGQTYYQLGVMPFEPFVTSYAHEGRSVEEDVLDLSAAEKERLYLLLLDNFRPQNRVYRYNFFTKNCTTQARDIIEQAADGQFVYPAEEPLTYRDVLHRYTARQPWLRFGQDLLVGAEADRQLDTRGQDFVPLLYQRDLKRAAIRQPDGSQRPAVSKTVRWAEQRAGGDAPTLLTPMAVLGSAFVLAVVVTLVQILLRRNWWWVDAPFLAVQGLAGCLVAFLFFFSEHPGVDSNWLLAVLNPLPLLYLPREMQRARRRARDLYHPVALAVIWGFTLLHPLTGQAVPTEALLFLNGVAALSVARILLAYLNNKHE